MGAWNNPVVLPQPRPSFGERLLPSVLSFMGNAYLQNQAQGARAENLGKQLAFREKLAEKQGEQAESLALKKGLASGEFRIAGPDDKPANVFQLGGKQVAAVPIEERFAIVKKDGVNILVDKNRAQQLTEDRPSFSEVQAEVVQNLPEDEQREVVKSSLGSKSKSVSEKFTEWVIAREKAGLETSMDDVKDYFRKGGKTYGESYEQWYSTFKETMGREPTPEEKRQKLISDPWSILGPMVSGSQTGQKPPVTNFYK